MLGLRSADVSRVCGNLSPGWVGTASLINRETSLYASIRTHPVGISRPRVAGASGHDARSLPTAR